MRDRLGAPLEYDREKRGFYYNEDGFYLPALYMGEGEALALFLSHHIGKLPSSTRRRGTGRASGGRCTRTGLSITGMPGRCSLSIILATGCSLGSERISEYGEIAPKQEEEWSQRSA